MMWTEICSINLDCSCKQFEDAVKVWITKPHTVNRRLVGTKVLLEVNRVDIRLLDNADTTELLSKLKDGRHLEACLEELDGKKKVETEEQPLGFMIRELIPKQLGRFHSARELIIKGKLNFDDGNACQFMFLPISHVDEYNNIVHCDDTLGYKLHFSETNKQLNISVTTDVKESPCTSLGVSEEWLQSVLLPKLLNWCKVTNLNTNVSSLKLVPVDQYTLLYQHLKEKHGKKLVENWPEKTDPRKFVYEDVAIAAYLILLWELDRKEKGLTEKQTFVDLGCGNGLLVYLLTQEGHKGVGLDIRKRNIWDMYGSGTDLREDSITPEKQFPDTCWLLGNHSDELTPWIPVFAARSSSHCNFFVLPCCTWDFTSKYNAKYSGISQYRAYLNYVAEVINVCGFEAEEDTLRIPSTKRVCFIGRKRTYTQSEWSSKDKEITAFIKQRTSNNHTSVIINDKEDHSENAHNKAMYGPHTENELILHNSDNSINVSDTTGVCSNTRKDVPSASSEVKQFVPRNYSDEKKAHCLTVDPETKGHIVKTVFQALLSQVEDKETGTYIEETWNKGGKLKLSTIVSMFNDETLKKLKSECGGMQTLLRNHHHVFIVQGGEVQLRDWRDSTLHDKHQQAKKKRKGQHLKTDATLLFKTKLCYFHENHPNGCPLSAIYCRFAHDESELNRKKLKSTDK